MDKQYKKFPTASALYSFLKKQYPQVTDWACVGQVGSGLTKAWSSEFNQGNNEQGFIDALKYVGKGFLNGDSFDPNAVVEISINPGNAQVGYVQPMSKAAVPTTAKSGSGSVQPVTKQFSTPAALYSFITKTFPSVTDWCCHGQRSDFDDEPPEPTEVWMSSQFDDASSRKEAFIMALEYEGLDYLDGDKFKPGVTVEIKPDPNDPTKGHVIPKLPQGTTEASDSMLAELSRIKTLSGLKSK